MKGDFSRNTFNPDKHFSGVLMQQGRVQLDADWNEQVSISQHYLRALARDLIGPHGGPGSGFAIDQLEKDPDIVANNFSIAAGHYYVDGILCENAIEDDKPVAYRLSDPKEKAYKRQPDYPEPPDLESGARYLVYLDVWERHITFVEDEQESEPGIREVALDGPDTATRTKVVWQVKVAELTGTLLKELIKKKKIAATAKLEDINKSWVDTNWELLLETLNLRLPLAQRAELKARAKREENATPGDPCTIDPEAKYRGHENQLYRVEIHTGGVAWDGKDDTKVKAATFKWSRENGSVVFPVVVRPQEDKVTVEGLERDGCLGLKPGDWVEYVDDHSQLNGAPPQPLLQVDKIEPMDGEVTLKSELPTRTHQTDYDPKHEHALLRRWDHPAVQAEGMPGLWEGTILVRESTNDDWLNIEDGVQIQFWQGTDEDTHQYCAGDYWLIPARTVTGDVEWPGTIDEPTAMTPHGIDHHYAPLALIDIDGNAKVRIPILDCRRTFSGVAKQAT